MTFGLPLPLLNVHSTDIFSHTNLRFGSNINNGFRITTGNPHNTPRILYFEMFLGSVTRFPVLPSEPLRLKDVLLSDVYWQLGTEYSDRVFARLMDGDDDEKDLTIISWGQVLNEAYQVSVYLKEQISEFTSPFTLGILATSNYAYYVHVIAAMLNDWTTIYLSTRNSLAGLESLINSVHGSVVVVDDMHVSMAKSMKNHMGINVVRMKNLEDLTAEYKLPIYHPRESVPSDEELDMIVYYIHTSGSQGHPKPIPYTHRRTLSDIRMAAAANYAGSPVYAPLPLFHGMGIYAFTRWPIGSGLIPTFVEMKQPLNGLSLARHLRRLPGAIAFLPPIVLEEVVQNNDGIDIPVLRNCKRILSGGAPLNQKAAETLIKHGVPLVNAYGSSETSLLTKLDFLHEDWKYCFFIEGQFDFQFLRSDDSDSSVRELFISPGPRDSPSIINCQEPVGFSTRDLWEPHPTKQGLWKYIGRKDAVTVMSNGEKTDNGQIESLLLEDPLISGVVVFGSGKPLNGVLIRPAPTVHAMDIEVYLNSIWATVERTNSTIPNHSRLLRQMIIIITEAKPFVVSDKGTIRQKETLERYETEIEEAYKSLETRSESALGAVVEISTLEDVLSYVRDAVRRVAMREIGDVGDFFEAGLDSLHAIQIRAELMPVLIKPESQDNDVPRNIVHAHPSIARLSHYAFSRRFGKGEPKSAIEEKKARIRDCIERFTADLGPKSVSNGHGSKLNGHHGITPNDQSTTVNGATALNGHATTLNGGGTSATNDCHTNLNGTILLSNGHSDDEISVVLTGSTGSLGCHLLNRLLSRNEVEHVYCFHRASSKAGFQRHLEICREREISVDALVQNKTKLHCIYVDLSDPQLGLNTEIMDEIRHRVTHIIHTAWELNFNWTLHRFEKTHIAGVRHLIDLAMSSLLPSSPVFVFLSSVGTVSEYGASHVPEQPFDDPSVVGSEGYGEAKYVAERIIDSASKCGLRGIVIRSGQLAGSTWGGYWAPSEYAPTLFRTSLALGKIPNDLPVTRWLPTDVAANCVLDVTFLPETLTMAYYHLENPTSTPWHEVIQLFTNACGRPLEAVPTQQWLEDMERLDTGGRGDSQGAMSALALHEFYTSYALAAKENSWPSLDVTKTYQISPAINFGRITGALMEEYAQWMTRR